MLDVEAFIIAYKDVEKWTVCTRLQIIQCFYLNTSPYII